MHGASESDIPYGIALRAHEGSSFVPERRAKQRQAEYVAQMAADYESLAKLADSDDGKRQLDEEFSRYREGYRQRYLAKLHADGRCMSPMIAGPSRFPVASNRKKLDSAHRRLEELIEFRERALKAIRRKLCPEEGPIMASNPQAIDLLEKQLAAAELLQARMKAINAAHKRFLKKPESLESSGLSESEQKIVREYKPAYSWVPHPFPPYRLSNNNANIRRIKERIADVAKLKASPARQEERADGISVEESPEDARIRIKFPGKPAAEVIAILKRRGFRWSPSNGAWQRQLNSAGRSAVADVLNNIAG